MELFDCIKATPLLRPNAFPSSRNVAIVCRAAALPHIPESLLQCAEGVYLIDRRDGAPEEVACVVNGKRRAVGVFPLAELAGRLSLDVVHFHHTRDYAPLASCASILGKIGFKSFFNLLPIPYNAGITTTRIPDYYADNRDALETVFAMLADEESREVFAARIRAIETGNVGYLRVSDFPEYFHPLVQPRSGDLLLDGGVSESIGAQMDFSKAVGAEGRIFGFEPDPVGFCRANDSLRERCLHDNYKILPVGLWSRKDTLYFDLAGQGTHVASGRARGAVACEVLSIDEFARSTRLPRVDFIKMDIEGAEAEAIKGAIRTITTYRPRLAISLYHTPVDLFHLPMLIKEIVGDYRFYLGHHHAALHETILYAVSEA